MHKVAIVQMTSSADREKNLEAAKALIVEAVKQQAKLIVLPENFAFMGMTEAERRAIAEPYGAGPIQGFLKAQAKEHHVWLVGGTLPLLTNDPKRIRSASLLINDQGECVARYDKIHLFDVTVDDASKVYMESASTEPGSEIVTAETPLGKLGLSVCYDIRFPELYRQLVKQGAELLAIPAAFTFVTGEAHWELLCRARAVENLAYVLAPGQSGIHANKRHTFGHSMIVDPWGRILAKQEAGEGIIVADINLQAQKDIRHKFPALSHQRVN